MSLDFSKRSELRGLARLTRALEAAAAPLEVPYFLMGATARDLMLQYAHGIQATRATEDADFAVMVPDWAKFEALRAELLSGGQFLARPGSPAHRLRHREGLPLDIVPFGGIERPDRTIAWPGEHGAVIHNCFGMQEALKACVEVTLPDDVRLAVPSIPALTILKIAAWEDRKRTHPGRDAPDLLLFAKSYADCDTLDRMASEHADLLASQDFDYVAAGARLLMREITRLLPDEGIGSLLVILLPESDETGPLLLAHQSRMNVAYARRLIEAMCEELASS